MTKHTDGPWKLETNRVLGANNEVVVELHYPINPNDVNDELACNARLIAQSPKMLELLKELNSFVINIGLDDIAKNGFRHEMADSYQKMISKIQDLIISVEES
jgi:hypothetical protein